MTVVLCFKLCEAVNTATNIFDYLVGGLEFDIRTEFLPGYVNRWYFRREKIIQVVLSVR